MSDPTLDDLRQAAQIAATVLNDSNSTLDQKVTAIIDILRGQRFI